MANLLGADIGTNYKGILSLDSTINTPLDATLRAVTDGEGNASLLQLSTDAVSVGGALGARLAVKGSGTTFATNSFLVQNSGGTNLFRVRDDGQIFCEGGGGFTSVGIIGTAYGLFGGASYEASASLVCGGTTTGFLPPRMTTTQKNAISSPASGLIVYDTTTNKLACYNGTTWNDLF
jgi:hypothetical protein